MKIISTTLVFIAVVAVCSSDSNHDIKIKPGGISGFATTTGYWDCCKPTCAWTGNMNFRPPVRSCQADGVTTQQPEEQSGCVGGHAYMCTDQAMRSVNSTLAYGMVAAGFGASTTTDNMCCACVMLTFTDQRLANKKMIVQLTNTGRVGPTEHDMFDIAMPGTGVGYYSQGCPTQWNSDPSNWGQQYGGVQNEADCYRLPQQLWDGCLFRFQWVLGIANPDVNYVEIECPDILTSISQCTPDH